MSNRDALEFANDPVAVKSLFEEVARSFGGRQLTEHDQFLKGVVLKYSSGTELNTREMIEDVGMLTSDMGREHQHRLNAVSVGGPSPSYPRTAFEFGRRFVIGVLREVRRIVCNAKELESIDKDSGEYPKAVAAALAASALNGIGISGPTALGVSMLILLIVAKASHDTFCNMTDEDVLKSLSNVSHTKPSS
jgi:hypothetical protein